MKLPKRAWIPASIALGYAAAIAILYWRVFTGQICGWDCLVEYWPDIAFQLDALGDGELPLWNPYSLGGYSFAGDVQAGTFAPANWVTWIVGAFTGPTPWLIQIKVWLGLWVALVGMHALVARRTGSHAAAAVAAVTFVLASPMMVHKNGAYLWPYLYLPLAVLALDAFAAKPGARRAVWLALGVWALGSAGHPHAFFACLLLLGGAWVVTWATADRPLAALRAQLPWLALAGLLAVLLLAPMLVPATDAVASSPRAHRTIQWVTQGGIPAAGYRELFVPDCDTNWAMDLYMGPLAVLAPLAAVLAARARRERVERGYWAAMIVFALVLAGGGPLLRLFAEHVPGFGLFRISNRWKTMAAFPVALLVGDAVQVLRAGGQSRWWRRGWLGLAAAFLVAAAAIRFDATAWLLAAATLAVATALLVRPHRVLAWLLPVVVFLDLWHADRIKLSILQPVPDLPRLAAMMQQLPGVDREWRYVVDARSAPTLPRYVAMLTHSRELTGHANPIVLREQEEIGRAAATAPLLFTHFGARWFVGRAPPGTTPVAGTPFREYAGAAPIARLYPAAEIVGRDQQLARLAVVAPRDLRAALVEDRAIPAAGYAPVDGRLVAYARNALEVELDAPGPGLLVVNETYFPGWTATVDGRAVPIVRANYWLRGVAIDGPGRHRIAMRYTARGYPWVLVGFAIASLAALALLLGRASWLARLRPTPSPSSSSPRSS